MKAEPHIAGSRPTAGSPPSSVSPEAFRDRRPARGPGRRGAGRPARRLAVLLATALALAAGATGAAAQELRPGTPLRELRTAYFDIYYPPRLEREARRLASFADGLREELAASLGLRDARRFPVLMSDAYEVLNGSFTPLPSDRITLYAAPTELDGALGNFDDDLRSLFLHELVHALTLTVRSPLWGAAALLFGDLAAPAFFLAPPSFVEGATVSAESAEGFGRVNDPLATAPVRQALVEGKSLGFWQAAGAWDGYPFGSTWYLYGGLFSSWLKERHGTEAYARLWREFGRGGPGSGIEDFLFMTGAFRRAFGEGLDEAWNAFLDDSEPDFPLLAKVDPLLREPGYLTALCAGREASGRELVFWNDPFAGGVLSVELEEGTGRPRPEPRLVLAADGYVNRLDLSPDGRRLLVSTAREEAGFPVLVVREWDLAARRFVGPELRGLREAAYVRGRLAGSGGGEASAAEAGPGEAGGRPIVAIATEGYRSDLVRLEEGGRELVLRGSERRSYGSPAAAGERTYAIARDGGKRLLLRVSEGLGSGAARVETLVAGAALPYPRFLSAVEGPRGATLAFAVADREGFYRLALLEEAEAGPSLFVQGGELSGGVTLPALAPAGPRQARPGTDAEADGGLGGRDGFAYRVYYRGSFAEGELPCRFPAGNPAVAPAQKEAAWVPLDPSFSARDAGGGAAAVEPAGSSDFAPRDAPPLPGLLRTTRLPLVGMSGVGATSEIDSAGLLLMGRDYAGFLTWQAAASYGWRAGAADLQLSTILGLAPFTATLSASDRFVAARSNTAFARETRAGAELSYGLALLPTRRRLEVGAFAEAAALGQPFAPGGAAGAAYALPYEGLSLLGGLRAGYRDLRRSMLPPNSLDGLSLGLELGAELPAAEAATGTPPALVLAAGGSLAFAPLGLELRADGVLSLDGRKAWGAGSAWVRSGGTWRGSGYRPRVPAYREYAGLPDSGAAYLAAEAGLGLLSAELQRRVAPLGLFARRLEVRGGLRGAWIGAALREDGSLGGVLEGQALASAFARAAVELSPTFGFGANLGLRLGAELAYAFREDLASSPVSLNLIVELAD